MTDRSINLSPWKEVSITKRMQHHTMIDVATVIIGSDGEFFYIHDDIEKIIDISCMPEYIKEDWINYNKKDLTIYIVEEHIRKYVDLRDSEIYLEVANQTYDDVISELQSIKRDLIIKKIIV
jgi:hypothetical protein